MKDLIKKILREETSGLTDGQIKAAYSLMNMITKDYYWYHDTPKQPFKFTPGSIWLINPKTKQWMLELKKSGRLWYYYKTSDTFSKYLNMEESDFKSFIKIWVVDALERGVISTHPTFHPPCDHVEDALERGVISTASDSSARWSPVEDALKNGKQLK